MNEKLQQHLISQNEFLIQTLKRNILSSKSLSQVNTPETFNALLTLANLHGVIPQFYKALKTISNINIVKQNIVQQRYLNIVKSNLLLTANLLKITETLESLGFNYLTIKGPALTQDLYQDISMRQFSDIDLFVNKKDIYAISESIIGLGYTSILPLSLLKNKKFLELDNDFSFRHKKNNTLIELHWELFPLRHKMPLEFNELHKTAKKLTIQSREVLTLSNEYNLLYLSLHGAKHIFERYEWVYDIHTLLNRHPELDLNSIYQKAKKAHLDTPLLLGIFLSQELFKTKLSKGFENYKTAHIEILLKKILAYYDKGFVHWDESEKKRARFLFIADLFGNKESKVFWLFKSLFKTTPVDVITFNLPNTFSFLYPLLRPFRLLYKFIFIKKPQYD